MKLFPYYEMDQQVELNAIDELPLYAVQRGVTVEQAKQAVSLIAAERAWEQDPNPTDPPPSTVARQQADLARDEEEWWRRNNMDSPTQPQAIGVLETGGHGHSSEGTTMAFIITLSSLLGLWHGWALLAQWRRGRNRANIPIP